MLRQDCGCGNVCDELAPSRIYKFLCASGASPRLRRRLRRSLGRSAPPRAARAPPFSFLPNTEKLPFFAFACSHATGGKLPVNRHRGEPGKTRDTRDTRTHKGTRTTQTNLREIAGNPRRPSARRRGVPEESKKMPKANPIYTNPHRSHFAAREDVSREVR